MGCRWENCLILIQLKWHSVCAGQSRRAILSGTSANLCHDVRPIRVVLVAWARTQLREQHYTSIAGKLLNLLVHAVSSLARHLLLYLGQCITPILQEGGLKEVKPLVVSSYSIMTSERFIRWIIATTESQTFGEKIPLFKKSYKIFATLHQSNLSQSILNFLTELFPQARLSLNTPPFIDSPHP